MAVHGESSSYLIQQFPLNEVKLAVKLILQSWKSFTTNVKLEDKITNKFYPHLLMNKDRSKYPFAIVPRPAEINEEGKEIGEIDLKCIYNNQEKIYFSFECKRLRVNFQSRFQTLAGQYVTEGMCRYFTGQYAQGLDKGGMIGYVMDGKTDQAVKDVRDAIERKRISLYMQDNETLKASSCIISKQVKETLHQYGPNNRFTLYHVFLPMSKN